MKPRYPSYFLYRRLPLPLPVMLVSIACLVGCPGDDAEVEPEAEPLSSAEVIDALQSRDAAVAGCVSRARHRNPRLAGRVEVAGTIETSGRVQEVRVEEIDSPDRYLEDCVLTQVRRVRFPEAEARTTFRHSWELGDATERHARDPVGERDFVFEQDEPQGDEQAPAKFRREEIERLAQRYGDEVRECYADAAKDDPELAGNVEITWAVDPSGAVRSPAVTGGTLDDGRVRACLVGMVRGWRFTPLEGSSAMRQTSYTWEFETREVREEP